jgi:hypothetical protein
MSTSTNGIFANNSSQLTFTVRLSSGGQMGEKTLQPHERISFADLFMNTLPELPETPTLTVLHNNQELLKRPLLDKDIYVGLLGPKPHIQVSFNDRSISRPEHVSDETLRMVNAAMELHAKQVSYSSFGQAFDRFICAHGMALYDSGQIRLEDTREAFEALFPTYSITQ